MKKTLALFLLVLVFGCDFSRNEPQVDQFLYYRGSSSFVNGAIADLMESVSQTTKDAYIAELGYPQWDFSTDFAQDSPALFVPLQRDSRVTAIIKVSLVHNEYRYKLITRGQLLKYGLSSSGRFPSALTYAGLFKHFDSKFGINEFDFYKTVTNDTLARRALAQVYVDADWHLYEITNCSVTCTSTDAGESWECHAHDCSVTYEWHYSDEPRTLEGPGGGGGGDGDGDEIPDGLEEAEAGIDCASFNFADVNDTWQEAAINDVHFYVRYFDAQGNKLYVRKMFIDRTLYFGFPKITYNKKLISPGMAAQAAASAIQYASDRVHSMFIETPNVMSWTVTQAFIQELKAYVQGIGGRVDFVGSNSPNVVPTTASYVLFGNGDCLD